MPITLPLKKMSKNEKLMAMEAIWQDLSQDENAIESPSWHGAVLRETERLVREGKAKFSDWEEAKSRIRRRLAKGA